MNQYWCIAFLIWTASAFGSGVWVEHNVFLAAQDHVETKVAVNLGKADAKIIKDNQALDSELSNDKDPCLKDKLPDGTD